MNSQGTCLFLVTTLGLGCVQLLHAADAPPRFKSTMVPAIAVEESETCCFTEVLGMGPDETVLGTVHGQGFSWRVNEEPALLSMNLDGFEPMFMNESGWIAGEDQICPEADGGCVRQVFLRSPEGEFSYFSIPEVTTMPPVGLSETNVLLFRSWALGRGSIYTVEPNGVPEELALPEGAGSPALYGMTPDGSVVSGAAVLNGAHIPLRWIGREVQILEVPAGYRFNKYGDAHAIAPDGSIVGSVRDVKTNWEVPVRWNAAGEFALLPIPAGQFDCMAAYADDDAIVGVTRVGDNYEAVIWDIADGTVVNYALSRLGSNLVQVELGNIVRVGDHYAIQVLDQEEYLPAVLVFSRSGADAVPCEDLVVLGEIAVDSTQSRTPWNPVSHRASNSMAVTVGHWQTESFLLERLRAGDVDGDDVVDGEDLTLLLGAWGTADRASNLDGNGVVDGADLMILLGDWG